MTETVEEAQRAADDALTAADHCKAVFLRDETEASLVAFIEATDAYNEARKRHLVASFLRKAAAR